MIDLTPLDVRKKRGDFKKSLRGYDPLEVDGFLELAAERMEELVKANITLEERAQRLGEQVVSLGGRERAVNEALVTAQQLRDEIRDQAQREAEQIRREAEREVAQLRKEAQRETEHLQKEARLEAKELLSEAERLLEDRTKALHDIEGQRTRFLEAYRQLLHRQLELVQVEENRSPLDDTAVELDLGGGRTSASPVDADEAGAGGEPGAEAVAEPEPDARTSPEEEASAQGIRGDDSAADPEVESVEEATAADDGWPAPDEGSSPEPAASPAVGTMELDEDGAVPVEGLAPSDDGDTEATILPAPGGAGSSLSMGDGEGEPVSTLPTNGDEHHGGERRDG